MVEKERSKRVKNRCLAVIKAFSGVEINRTLLRDSFAHDVSWGVVVLTAWADISVL